MPAELHLAKDAFALHLSLQRLEGLIDIVVADKNLHVVLPFDPTVDRPNSQSATAARICVQPLPGRYIQFRWRKTTPRDVFARALQHVNSLAAIRLNHMFFSMEIAVDLLRARKSSQLKNTPSQGRSTRLLLHRCFSCGEASATRLWRNHWIVISRVGRP